MNSAIHSYSSVALDQIRLMHLAPGTYNDAIVCNLRRVLYRSTRRYEALSYVWGDEHDKRGILVHGCHFPITPSLELALRHLRHPSDERVIWVDQICIDQANDKEKTEQVKLMGNIYRNASDVLIWLGDQTLVSLEPRILEEFTFDECKRALDLVSMLSTDGHLDQLQCFGPSKENRLQPTKEFSPAFNALRRLMQMPWWTRIWTVQEIVLAHKANVLIGTQSIRWEQLESAALSIRKHRNNCCLRPYGTLTQEVRKALDQFYLPIRDLAIRRDRLGDDHTPDLILDLQNFRHRQSKDPRDKIYGLMGLHPHRANTTDYNRPFDQVYVDVLMNAIMKEKDLRALVNENTIGQDNGGLPSWVIDWRAPIDNNRFRIRLFKYHAYSSSKGSVASARLVNGSLLQLCGFRIDKILTVQYSEAFSKGSDVYSALDKFREHLQDYFSPDDLYITGGTFGEAFWRTTLGNRVWESSGDSVGYRSIVENDLELYEAFCCARRAWSNEDSFGRVAGTVEHSLYKRAFFLTTQGYIGIGPRTTKVGDDICVVLGSNVPFVTRSVVDSCVNELEGLDPCTLRYHLVGDCYVHGIMEGEAMDQSGRQLGPIVLY